MEQRDALIGSAAFFVIAPGVVAAVVPWLITDWRFGADAGLGIGAVGVALIVTGLAVLIDCFVRFAVKGGGTPAPVAPPSQLVISGLYAHVRNPMYVGVLLAVFGQALLFASAALIAYGVTLWFVFLLFILYYEEPRLARAFPETYPPYAASVPRWIPRLTPWRPSPPEQPD